MIQFQNYQERDIWIGACMASLKAGSTGAAAAQAADDLVRRLRECSERLAKTEDR